MNVDKVIWQEGMLLRPQHFQHNDRYYDHQMRVRTQLLGSYTWGFLTLEIDTEFLGMGKVVISRASGILPDGTWFQLTGRAGPLTLIVPANTGNAPIYLGLPLVTGNHIEARRTEQLDVLARYTTYEENVADSNAGEGNDTRISCARPDFKLLLAEQQSDQAYVKLKVCEVLNSSPDSVITLNSEFVPTYIQAHSSAYLLSCLKEVISMLGLRGEAIAERVRSNGKVSGAEVGDFMMLQLINRTEVLLRHFLAQEQVHPEEIFRSLLAMLGDLSTFANDTKRPRLDNTYHHSDQGASFRKLMDDIRQVLSMVLEQHAFEMEMQTREYGIIVSPLHDRSFLGSCSFVLAASANCDTEDLRKRLPAHLKVASVEHIREISKLHLQGIKVRPLAVAPRQIAFHSNKTYFILELSPDDQAQLEHSGGFAFHFTSEFPGLELKFWAIRN